MCKIKFVKYLVSKKVIQHKKSCVKNKQTTLADNFFQMTGKQKRHLY